jgi:hypothetical protein
MFIKYRGDFILNVPVLSLWNRIQGFIAALLSGLIFLIAGINLPIFGRTILEFLQTTFPGLSGYTQTILNIMMLIASYTGVLVLVAAVLILLGRTAIARVILFFVVSVGIFAFAVPVFTALFQGANSLEIAINGISTKYALAALFALLAKNYAKKV